MAKQTRCKYDGNMVDNRAIKAHERAHEKAGDQISRPAVGSIIPANEVVVTPSFQKRLKEAKKRVKAKTVILPQLHPATYNIERREQIKKLRDQGLGYRKIGQQMNLHPVRVRKICKELKI